MHITRMPGAQLHFPKNATPNRRYGSCRER